MSYPWLFGRVEAKCAHLLCVATESDLSNHWGVGLLDWRTIPPSRRFLVPGTKTLGEVQTALLQAMQLETTRFFIRRLVGESSCRVASSGSCLRLAGESPRWRVMDCTLSDSSALQVCVVLLESRDCACRNSRSDAVEDCKCTSSACHVLKHFDGRVMRYVGRINAASPAPLTAPDTRALLAKSGLEERRVVFFEETFPARFEYLDTSVPDDLGLSPQGGSILVVQHCRDFGDLAPAPPTLVWNEGYWEKVGTEISTSWKSLSVLGASVRYLLYISDQAADARGPLFSMLPGHLIRSIARWTWRYLRSRVLVQWSHPSNFAIFWELRSVLGLFQDLGWTVDSSVMWCLRKLRDTRSWNLPMAWLVEERNKTDKDPENPELQFMREYYGGAIVNAIQALSAAEVFHKEAVPVLRDTLRQLRSSVSNFMAARAVSALANVPKAANNANLQSSASSIPKLLNNNSVDSETQVMAL